MADNMEDAQQEQHQEDAVVEAVAAALDAEASSSESEEEEGSHSDAEDSEDAPMTSALSQDPLSEGDEEQQAGGTNPSGDVASTDQDAAAPAGPSGLSDFEDYKQEGNRCFERKEYEEAVALYSTALKMANISKHQEAVIYSNRSATYAAWSQQLRARPAAASERRALYGHDPLLLAERAAKDAERAVQARPDWAKAFSRLGVALFLLERYPQAAEAYQQGLDLEPGNAGMQEGLDKVQAILKDTPAAAAAAVDRAGSPAKRQRLLDRDASDDFECILCMKLLHEPVTTPCGHSFCKGCLVRAQDHSNKCPMCRTVLHVARDLPVTITLKNILQKCFPEEYASREQEEAEQAAAAAQRLPLFVMTALLPGETMALNIFEPRYRLLVRRCMEGGRRLGMAQQASAAGQGVDGIDDVACEAEITECQAAPDGRYYIEVVGRRRVRLSAISEQDGYRVARAEPLQDDPPEAGQEAELAQVSEQVSAKTQEVIDKLRSASAGRRLAQVMDLVERLGQRPPAGEHERISFWAAGLLVNTVMGQDYRQRGRLLRTTSTLERLTSLKTALQGITGPQTCRVM